MENNVMLDIFLGHSKFWSLIVIVYLMEQQAITVYSVMTCGLLQGQYGGDHCICQSASNLLSITYN